MSLVVALLLGIVQGVFMFIPVSSTAHLVLTQHFLLSRGYDLPPPNSAEMILLDLVLHVGTLVSIVIVFHKSLFHFLGDLLVSSKNVMQSKALSPLPLSIRLFLLGMLSVFVTGVMGLTMKTGFELVFGSPFAVGFTLCLTGILLWWTDVLSRRKLGLKQMKIWHALAIGGAQGLALMPGLSRSGITIVTALVCGMKRRWAAEYSFFIAIPTIMAATLLQGVEVFMDEFPSMLGWEVYFTGFVSAAIVGTFALHLVLKLLYAARLKIFSYYLWLLALLVWFGLMPITSAVH
ncbi:undecaprenyl-diphosphate phosphatase [Desulfonatronovibrio magnus]|uniref:undecaprenyl-diphosphate phosphatase n=1 Tax=Desulfonatronovibrio magnus TaxID=698827 RepID=UPI0005EB6DDC|nr:undecaprenyl-diphosphate phosphatase [Desulfonatronovibrio magnus]